MTLQKIRCPWCTSDPLYIHYHDHEWGVPSYDDHHLFEMLILEGAQAGLSWITVLKRRQAYREAFYDFDPALCAKMSDDALEALLKNEKLIRNRLKIFSMRRNAKVFLSIQKECGSFSNYLWGFTDGKVVDTRPQTMADVQPFSPLSTALSKDLQKRGMTFVGKTIMHAYLQAVGVINDHIANCFKRD